MYNLFKKAFIKVGKSLSTHGLLVTIVKAFRYSFYIRRNIRYRNMLKGENLEEKFSQIFAENLWSSKESASGTGSEVNYTKELRGWLREKIPFYDVNSIVDAPCGDFNWMRLVIKDTAVTYTGIDIVPELIKQNKKYESLNISFVNGNICQDPLPKCDLIIIRDCLFHLSFSDIDLVLNNLSKTDYRYLLTTSHFVSSEFVNHDIISGDFRLINLFLPPFNFCNSSVMDRVNDYPNGAVVRKEMFLISKQDVPESISVV